MTLSEFGRLWSLARKVEDLFNLQTDVRAAPNLIEEQLRAIENRMTRLETEQTQIITEARSAASAASTVIVAGVISDTVTRITRLEGRADQLEARRLPPPPAQNS